jgi:hypothetical protein
VLAGFLSCATCHIRIQPDGSVIEGAQGTLPDLILGFPPDVKEARAFQRALYRVPWLDQDPIDRVQKISVDDINAVKAAIPLGVTAQAYSRRCRFPISSGPAIASTSTTPD